jgi:hypothetical protein
MVRLLNVIIALSPGSNASIPVGLCSVCTEQSFPALPLCLSDPVTHPGIRWVAPFPSCLFFCKGLVLPRIGVTHSLSAVTKSVPMSSATV